MRPSLLPARLASAVRPPKKWHVRHPDPCCNHWMQHYSCRPISLPRAMQVLEAAHRWCARHDPPAVKMPLGQNGFNPCLAGSSISNTRSSGTNWSSGAAADPLPPGGDALANDASSSGRSSEEGSSAAWRLAAWLQRQGWPAQHCASFRSGSSGVGGSGTGWRFTSGHEFVLLYPHHCGGAPDPGGGAAAAAGSDSSSTTSSTSGTAEAQLDGMAADMACDAPAIVVDPEFATQFALTSPTPRYQVGSQLCRPGRRCRRSCAHQHCHPPVLEKLAPSPGPLKSSAMQAWGTWTAPPCAP